MPGFIGLPSFQISRRTNVWPTVSINRIIGARRRSTFRGIRKANQLFRATAAYDALVRQCAVLRRSVVQCGAARTENEKPVPLLTDFYSLAGPTILCSSLTDLCCHGAHRTGKYAKAATFSDSDCIPGIQNAREGHNPCGRESGSVNKYHANSDVAIPLRYQLARFISLISIERQQWPHCRPACT